MVIVDEKNFMPYGAPPPYAACSTAPPLFPHGRDALTLTAWPSHLLLQVVYMTFPQAEGFGDEIIERQRKTLYWLSVRLRLVNRAFYIACMHILRSTYLPAYNSLIRSPYTSDPFPHSIISAPLYTSHPSPSSSTSHIQTDPGSIQSLQRETSVLDYFIALKVREDVWADDSGLHLEREESFKDLFDLMQPRSRIEDLVRHYGMSDGLISIGASSSGRFIPTSPGVRSSFRGERPTPLPFNALSVSFSPRDVRLVMLSQGRKRTIVSIARTREEKLEHTAKRLVKELGVYLWSSH